MAENYPDQVKPLPRIRLKVGVTKPVEILTAAEVAAYLDALASLDRYAYTFEIVRFQCALRILEAASLRRQDIDFNRRLLTVTDTDYHVPKTTTSYRTIPIPSEALQALRDWVADQSLHPITVELFLNRSGRVWGATGGSQRIKKWMKRAAAMTNLPRLGEVKPHCLRATCATFASRLGCPDRLVRAYLGHAGDTVLQVHYQGVDPEELRLVSSRLDEWRGLIADPISGSFLATTE